MPRVKKGEEKLHGLRISRGAVEKSDEWRTARVRREAAQAALVEAKLAEKRGELVPAADVEARLVSVFGMCRTKLLGIATRTRQRLPHLTGKDVAVIDSLVREALEDLAAGGA